MAGYSSEEKWKQQPQQLLPYSTQEEENEEEEEEEALSLCDLPVSLIKQDDTQTRAKEEEEEEEEQSLLKESSDQEEFEFGRLGGDTLSIRSEMCAAEDIFYKGQILPLRHSFSSTSNKGLIHDKLRHDILNPVGKCYKDEFWVSTISSNLQKSMSRSESMDRALLYGFNSFSSRSSSSSSSSRSTQYSSTTTTNSYFVTKRIVNDKNSKPRAPDNFRGSHPSPGPQIRHSNVSPGSSNLLGSGFIRNRKSSSVWDFFKLGLVRTPGNGIHELQDLRVRSSVSRNSSSGSSSISIGNSNSNLTARSKKNNNISNSEKGQVKKQGLFEKRGGSLISGCNCTVNAVKPVPLNYVFSKSNNSNNNVDGKKNKRKKKKKKKSVEKLIKQNEVGRTEDGLGKQETSCHRTFEWVKELPHASYLDQQEKEVVASWGS